MNITSYAPGRFSWAEVATPDAVGSTAFYTALLGLAAGDVQVGEGDPYTILNKNGHYVCGLYGMSAEDMQRVSGGRAVWRAYFTVADADQALKRVGDLGGTVIHEPIAIGTDGRVAVAQDPTGATFSMWEPGDHHGAQVLGEPGALTWAELYTRDTQAASSFYGGLFGWTSSTVPSPAGGEYTLFQLDGQEAAGMMGMHEEWGPMPPHWAVYFDVADLDDARTRAGGLGGGEVMPPMQVEGVGRFAFLQDPQGGVFAVIQPEQREG
ncbi:MAG: VOC family protein [Candidatus Tectomicrobia bacterium]|nr:VOC family protein [Candidatus Tectomicrobia bacterium]